MTENTISQPVFYTRDHDDYKGTKVALWETAAPQSPGSRSCQYNGKIGNENVKLWQAKGPRGVYFNIQREQGDEMVPFGVASPFTGRGVNTLSISLRFDSLATAEQAKTQMNLRETPKSWKGVFFVNVFANVSINAVEAKPDSFSAMGFLSGEAAVRLKKPRP